MFTLSRARTWCALILSLSLSGLTQASIALPYSQLISFGDSLSDRGNVFTATFFSNPAAPYVAGQFSNGTVWTGLLAAQLGGGVSSNPSNLGGTNYAWGGARTFTGGGGMVPTTQDQVNEYISDVGDFNADPNALYTIWTGGNDINGVLTGDPLANFGTAASTVAVIAQKLIDNGAQNILINNLPNLGLVPGVTALGAGAVAGATSFTTTYNSVMEDALALVIGGNITIIDAFTLTNDIVANPGAFGLTNATDRCLALDGITPCANPEDYLFWDDLHPTAAGHELIAAAAYAAVIPVPAALPLMLSALMGLGVIKRLRKA